MRASGWVLVVLAGCQPSAPPGSASHVVEPADFATWPRITEQPVKVGPKMWKDCRGPSPHAYEAIVVRVSPAAVVAFRQGSPLPVGAVVVKEKYADRLASGPMQE